MKNLYQDEQPQKYIINSFLGTDQSIDESLLDSGKSKNNQNCITRDGVLEVTQGNTKYITASVPGGVQTIMLFYHNQSDGTVQKTLLAASQTAIYKWNGSNWVSIKTGLQSGRFSFINYQKGNTEIIIMSNGIDPMLKWDGVTLANLGGEPFTPKGTSISLHYERVWVTGNRLEPNMVYFSKDMDPEFWDDTDPNGDDPLATAGGVIDIPTWDGGVNIGLSTIFDNIVIFKTYSLWKILGTYPGEYEKVRIHSSSGAIAERSIVDGGIICFFLSMDGVFVYDGVKAYPISEPIKNIIKNMDPAYRDKAVGVFYKNRYILALPESGSTENNCIVEYDTISQTWGPIKRGFNVNDFLVFDDKLLFSNNAGYILEYEKGNDFDGVPIEAFWETPKTSYGPLSKTIHSTKFYGDVEILSGTGGLKVEAVFDGKPSEVIVTGPVKKGKRLRGKGRKFFLRFSNINGSRFRLKQPELHLDMDED